MKAKISQKVKNEIKNTEIARTISLFFYLCYNFQMSLGIFSSRRIIFVTQKKIPFNRAKEIKMRLKVSGLFFYIIYFFYRTKKHKNTKRQQQKKKIVKDVPLQLCVLWNGKSSQKLYFVYIFCMFCAAIPLAINCVKNMFKKAAHKIERIIIRD